MGTNDAHAELTITVTETEFCHAVARAVTDYFEGGECSGSEFAGPPIALAAFDLLRADLLLSASQLTEAPTGP